jgi:hypothetical protein
MLILGPHVGPHIWLRGILAELLLNLGLISCCFRRYAAREGRQWPQVATDKRVKHSSQPAERQYCRISEAAFADVEPMSGFEPLTCRLQGAIGPSSTVAGRRMISRLPAPIVTGRRPAPASRQLSPCLADAPPPASPRLRAHYRELRGHDLLGHRHHHDQAPGRYENGQPPIKALRRRTDPPRPASGYNSWPSVVLGADSGYGSCRNAPWRRSSLRSSVTSSARGARPVRAARPAAVPAACPVIQHCGISRMKAWVAASLAT